MSYGADTVAGALLTSLLTGEDITLPEVDLDDPLFAIPGDPETSAIYADIDRITNEELTEKDINGDGTFDTIMGGFRAQLLEEFSKNRISGAEYTKAFVALTESAMSNAVQFLVARDNAFWQAATAQAQAVTARVGLATAKVQLAIAQMQAMNARAEYALTKLKLATEDAQYGQIKFQVDNLLPLQGDQLTAQITGIDKQNAVLDYQLATQLPAQTALVNEQKEAARAQTLDTRSNNDPVTGVLGKQKLLYAQQVDSYAKASKLNAAKMISDAYLTVGAVEDFPGGPATNITKDEINEVYTAIRADNDLGS